jgi:hypothetical protein
MDGLRIAWKGIPVSVFGVSGGFLWVEMEGEIPRGMTLRRAAGRKRKRKENRSIEI